MAQICLDSRLLYESLELLMDFLAFLVPKLCPKKPKSCKNSLGLTYQRCSSLEKHLTELLNSMQVVVMITGYFAERPEQYAKENTVNLG